MRSGVGTSSLVYGGYNALELKSFMCGEVSPLYIGFWGRSTHTYSISKLVRVNTLLTS